VIRTWRHKGLKELFHTTFEFQDGEARAVDLEQYH
jgi:hypothetical protein